MGFKSLRQHRSRSTFTLAPCISLSFTIFRGKPINYRLILTATPIDEQSSLPSNYSDYVNGDAIPVEGGALSAQCCLIIPRLAARFAPMETQF